jgi:hypothetical protein
MSEVNKEDYMKDRKGRLVPVDQVSDYDLAMDSFVKEQVAAAKLNAMNSATSSVVPLTSAMPGLTLWPRSTAERAAVPKAT